MRLDDYDDQIRVEDQGTRMGGGGGGGLGGLLGLLPLLMGRKMGCGTIALIAVVGFFLFSSGGLQQLTGPEAGAPSRPAAPAGTTTQEICDASPERKEMCNALASLDRTWGGLMQGYERPKLSFYSQAGESGCGAAQSAMGPFYCPADQGIYLDTDFFREMDQRMGAKGDFARYYVIAHEMGHHIQTISGTSDKVRQAQSRASRAEGNAIQVAMELQADCYAGVWAARNRDRIEPGDMQEGLTAANAIGDDTLQKAAGQRPVPESFTHGTSAQRMQWLKRGLETGDPAQCNTFG